MRGIVPLFGPQIDPGFCGILVVPIFNAGDAPVSLQFGEKIFTVEFVRTRRAASFGWSERNGRQHRIRSLHTAFESRPNLADISDIGRKVSALETDLADSTHRFQLAVTELQRSLESLRVEFNAKSQIWDNKISDLHSSRGHFFNLWMFIVAIVALIIGLLASPWFERTLRDLVK
jgi:hypothetical protein